MSTKKLKINIRIDGRNYKLTINETDEERYRKAAKNVNDLVRKFRDQFVERDTNDILAMTAFQVALNNLEWQESEDKTLFIGGLKNLNDDISDFLKDKTTK